MITVPGAGITGNPAACKVECPNLEDTVLVSLWQVAIRIDALPMDPVGFLVLYLKCML